MQAYSFDAALEQIGHDLQEKFGLYACDNAGWTKVGLADQRTATACNDLDLWD